jgi:hypothetical protein
VILTASPVASDHYVLLADPAGASLWFQAAPADEPPRFVRVPPLEAGLLVASNGPADPVSGWILDPRAERLADLVAGGRLDAGRLRGALGAAYLPGVNCQAMVFLPARRALQLATGTSNDPASLGAWVELDLRRALAGEGLATVQARPLPAVAREVHYTEVERRARPPRGPEAAAARRPAAAAQRPISVPAAAPSTGRPAAAEPPARPAR